MTAMMMERTSAKQSGRRPARTDYVYVVTSGATVLGATRTLVGAAKAIKRITGTATPRPAHIGGDLWISGVHLIERTALSN